MYRLLVVVALCLPLLPRPAAAQASQAESESTSVRAAGGVPLERLIATVAKKTGKKFLIDPRSRAEILLLGQEPSEISYAQFLTVLDVYGFAAVDDGTYVRIVPDVMMKAEPTPIITDKDTRLASEWVTQVIPVRYASAVQLVPILRQFVPTPGALVASPSANALVIVDRFANLRRVEAIVKALDTPESKLAPKEPEK